MPKINEYTRLSENDLAQVIKLLEQYESVYYSYHSGEFYGSDTDQESSDCWIASKE